MTAAKVMETENRTASIIQFPARQEAPKETPQKEPEWTIGKVVAHEPVQPIKDPEDIRAAKEYLLSRPERYRKNRTNLRNHMLFVVGINNGIRIGDLLKVRIGDVMNDDGTLVEQLYIREQKTGKTRYLFFGPGSREAIRTYLDALGAWDKSDFLFASRQKRGGENAPLSRSQAWRIISEMGRKISEGRSQPLHLGTHSLRKTRGYQLVAAHKDDPTIVAQVSELYNHSSMRDTYRYLGMDAEQKKALCIDNEL